VSAPVDRYGLLGPNTPFFTTHKGRQRVAIAEVVFALMLTAMFVLDIDRFWERLSWSFDGFLALGPIVLIISLAIPGIQTLRSDKANG
jgi:hypothetical protein